MTDLLGGGHTERSQTLQEAMACLNPRQIIQYELNGTVRMD